MSGCDSYVLIFALVHTEHFPLLRTVEGEGINSTPQQTIASIERRFPTPIYERNVRRMSEQEEGMAPWLSGVLLTIMSAFVSTIGLLMQKYAHTKQQEMESQGKTYKVYFGIPCNAYFVGGFLVLVFLPLPLDFLALAQAGQSLIVPVGTGCTVVFGQILAPRFLGEKLTRLDIMATAFIVFGVFLATAFGSHASPSYPVEMLVAFLYEVGFVVMLLASLLLMALSLGITHNEGVAAHFSTKFQIVSLAYIPAILGSLQMMCFKVIGELSKNTVSGIVVEFTTVVNGTSILEQRRKFSNAFESFEIYLFLVMVLCLASFQITYMNRGLKNYNAIKFLPVYNTMLLMTSSIVGSVYFKEYDFYHPVAFPFGILCIAGGIGLLAWKSEKVSESIDGSTVHPFPPVPDSPEASPGCENSTNGDSVENGTTKKKISPEKIDSQVNASPPNSASQPQRRRTGSYDDLKDES